jgi:hypothetical protein
LLAVLLDMRIVAYQAGHSTFTEERRKGKPVGGVDDVKAFLALLVIGLVEIKLIVCERLAGTKRKT